MVEVSDFLSECQQMTDKILKINKLDPVFTKSLKQILKALFYGKVPYPITIDLTQDSSCFSSPKTHKISLKIRPTKRMKNTNYSSYLFYYWKII